MTDDSIGRIGRALTKAITYARESLSRYGVDSTVADTLDEEAGRATFHVLVAGTPVYTLTITFGGGTADVVTGRWQIEALRALALGTIADRAEAAHGEVMS